MAVFALSLLLLAPGTAFAQSTEESPNLRWTVQAVPVQGDAVDVDLVFDSDIAPGWVVYASDFAPPELGPRPAKIRLDDSMEVRAEGALASTRSQAGSHDLDGNKYAYRYFNGHAQFRQRVRRDPGAKQVGGTLSGQSCQEQSGLCTVFREKFSVAL